MNYILELEENERGELHLDFPDDITDTLGWGHGDILEWDMKGLSLVLTKLHDSKGYEVQEE